MKTELVCVIFMFDWFKRRLARPRAPPAVIKCELSCVWSIVISVSSGSSFVDLLFMSRGSWTGPAQPLVCSFRERLLLDENIVSPASNEWSAMLCDLRQGRIFLPFWMLEVGAVWQLFLLFSTIRRAGSPGSLLRLLRAYFKKSLVRLVSI